jgi:hypothetical protein
MSFLNELKSQAQSVKDSQHSLQQDLAAVTKATELACQVAWKYWQDFCAQLNVLQPPAPGRYSLDGKAPFPELQLRNFRCDARKKMHRSQEMFDYVGLVWDLLPTTGKVAQHSVTVNFPPDLERVQQRLSLGNVRYERKEQRHPETNKLQAYVFEYDTQSRGSAVMTADQDLGVIAFRVVNVGEFGVLSTSYPAAQVTSGLLDELAKKIVGQPSRFG